MSKNFLENLLKALKIIFKILLKTTNKFMENFLIKKISRKFEKLLVNIEKFFRKYWKNFERNIRIYDSTRKNKRLLGRPLFGKVVEWRRSWKLRTYNSDALGCWNKYYASNKSLIIIRTIGWLEINYRRGHLEHPFVVNSTQKLMIFAWRCKYRDDELLEIFALDRQTCCFGSFDKNHERRKKFHKNGQRPIESISCDAYLAIHGQLSGTRYVMNEN